MWPFKRRQKQASLPDAHADKTPHAFTQWVPQPVLPRGWAPRYYSERQASKRSPYPFPQFCPGLTWMLPSVGTAHWQASPPKPSQTAIVAKLFKV